MPKRRFVPEESRDHVSLPFSPLPTLAVWVSPSRTPLERQVLARALPSGGNSEGFISADGEQLIVTNLAAGIDSRFFKVSDDGMEEYTVEGVQPLPLSLLAASKTRRRANSPRHTLCSKMTRARLRKKSSSSAGTHSPRTKCHAKSSSSRACQQLAPARSCDGCCERSTNHRTAIE